MIKEAKIKENKIPILSLWMARELERRGFKHVSLGINYNHPKFNVYYFEDSNEIRDEINNILGRKYYDKIS